jgi:hypothetical protein
MVEQKTCISCGEVKPLEEYTKNGFNTDGKQVYKAKCKPCYNSYKSEWRLARPDNYEKSKDVELKRLYGIGYQEYLNMLAAQQYACAICGTTDTGAYKAFHVDHCHTTGVVRGLLCSNCNTGIGNLRDDIELLKRAIQYLESVE